MARADAQKAMGDRFDIKQFHAIVEESAMPLSMLEKRVAARARIKR